MPEGKRRLTQALSKVLSGKADRIRYYPALLGAYYNGQKTIRVASRPDFVWCRLRGATSEVIQAFNDRVGLHFDLPILVYRDPDAPDIWKIHSRDVRSYSDWEGASYLPPHGDSHSLAGADRTGADPVWVAKRQFLPLLPHPTASGSMGIFVDPDFYFWGDQYNWWPGSGTEPLTTHKPTGAGDGRFVTVYISGSAGILALMDGPEFNALYPPSNPGAYITLPSPADGIPLAAVFLLTGTERIGWGEIYDLRFAAVAPGSATGSTMVFVSDEGILLGSFDRIDFAGAGVAASLSGTSLTVTVPGGGSGGSGSVQIRDEAVPLGSADIIDFVGDGVTVTISGTYVQVSIPGGGAAGTGTMATYLLAGMAAALDPPTNQYWQVPVYPYATGSLSIMLNGVWQKPGFDFSEQFPQSGTFSLASVPPTGTISAATWGVLAGDEASAATGSVVVYDEDTFVGLFEELRFIGAGVEVFNSGSYAAISIPAGAAAAGADQIGVYVTDDGVPLGTGTRLDTGYGLDSSISGATVRIDVEPPISGSVVVADDGLIEGSATIINFAGDGVSIEQSGSYATVNIPGAAAGPGGAGMFALDDGRPIGTGTSEDYGRGLWVTLSGSRQNLQGGYFYQDHNVYGSGSPFNWHFDAPMLPAAWTVTGVSPLPPYDQDASWPSHLHATLSGAQDIRLQIDDPGYFSPASGNASVTVAAVVTLASVSTDGIEIGIENGLVGAGLNSFRGTYLRAATDNPEIRMDKTVGGANTFNIGLRNTDKHNRVYLHLERIGSGTWGAAMSSDGLGWIPVTTTHSQYFGDLSKIHVKMFRASSLLQRSPFGLDWIKFNDLFLFS